MIARPWSSGPSCSRRCCGSVRRQSLDAGAVDSILRGGAGVRCAFCSRAGAFDAAARTRSARLLTTDPARQLDESWWAAQNPALVSGGVSFGWLRAAFQSVALLERSGYLEAIRTPLMVLASGDDRIVDLSATQAACARLPHAAMHIIAGAQHELLRERDALRMATLRQIRDFLRAPTAP
ncbi:hypothetical protein E6W36_15625 [Hankyongella ginsenosidimutans]|uniref:Serine aminopeptidase S33 domain-containing protein n=1 Tax=Hankyongella ginsenosidimutans TaxID=1763828 RepID=A0A4D7CAH1_9SPHN|nr:hypothetical protein E6W36_15625 [Hankyongella ginsenosidimutans]